MAHPEQKKFCLSVKKRLPHFFTEKWVLDIGSLDINGNNQYLFDECGYIGVDLSSGKNVDLASAAHELLLPDSTFDVVISTECFEHDQFYDKTILNIVRMLKPGGLFVFSCATTGRPEHGTRRTTPQDAPLTHMFGEWGDYYKNLDEGDIRAVLDVEAHFDTFEFSIQDTTHDLYFWGVKKGELISRTDYSFLQPDSPQRRIAQQLESRCRDLESSILEFKASLEQSLSALTGQISQAEPPSGESEQLNESVAELRSNLEESRNALAEQMRNAELYRAETDFLKESITELRANLARSQADLHRQARYADLHCTESERLTHELTKIHLSRSWRITRPLRFAARLARGEFAHAFGAIEHKLGDSTAGIACRRIVKGVNLLLRGEFHELQRRISVVRRKNVAEQLQEVASNSTEFAWCILTPPHTLFIARLIAHQLKRHGWKYDILTKPPQAFTHDLYIVLCPQIFDRLPPGEKRIAFQLEQSVSSRWFSDTYLKTLNESLAILDYSLVNIQYLAGKGIAFPQVNYLPIGSLQGYGSHLSVQEKNVDVVFYGDSLSSSRRTAMLEALGKRFTVKIVNDTFGDDLLKIIKSARLVVNIHYYENALLETPRIQECISLGVHVVSEGTYDQNEYPELLPYVSFFREGDIEDMIATVAAALQDQETPPSSGSNASQDRFPFLFDRFLIGLGLLPVSHVRQMKLPLPQQADTFGLSLPETIERRRIFEGSKPHDCVVFDGIRRSPGWVGCGLSYSTLAKHALGNGLRTMTVMEDDVILPGDYVESFPIIRAHLASLGDEWDVFAGVIASLHPDTKIVSVIESFGRMFVTIDKMTSMVFNIYSERAMRILQDWDPTLLDAHSNTIDRFLESRANLRVVTTYPYFVGHREEVSSTLWGFRNSVYLEMIRDSEVALKLKIEQFLLDRERGSLEALAI